MNKQQEGPLAESFGYGMESVDPRFPLPVTFILFFPSSLTCWAGMKSLREVGYTCDSCEADYGEWEVEACKTLEMTVARLKAERKFLAAFAAAFGGDLSSHFIDYHYVSPEKLLSMALGSSFVH